LFPFNWLRFANRRSRHFRPYLAQVREMSEIGQPPRVERLEEPNYAGSQRAAELLSPHRRQTSCGLPAPDTIAAVGPSNSIGAAMVDRSALDDERRLTAPDQVARADRGEWCRGLATQLVWASVRREKFCSTLTASIVRFQAFDARGLSDSDISRTCARYGRSAGERRFAKRSQLNGTRGHSSMEGTG